MPKTVVKFVKNLTEKYDVIQLLAHYNGGNSARKSWEKEQKFSRDVIEYVAGICSIYLENNLDVEDEYENAENKIREELEEGARILFDKYGHILDEKYSSLKKALKLKLSKR